MLWIKHFTIINISLPKMKTYQTLYMICGLLLTGLATSCKNDDDNGLVVFQVAVKSVDGDQVTLVVTHNGSNRDNYCGFALQGEVADVQQAISEYLASNSSPSLKEQKKKVIKLSGLAPHTTYTYIVFGLTNEHDLYGVTASITFATGDARWRAQVNDNWTVTYHGATLYSNNYYSHISVDVAEGSDEAYFVTDYMRDDVDSYDTEEAFISFAVDDHNRHWQAASKDDFWKEDFELYTASSQHYAHLLPTVEYVTYAIGLTSDGRPTGHYAKSEPYKVDAYPMLPAYQLLFYKSIVNSKWVLENEETGQQQECTLKEYTRNQSFGMCWDALTYNSLNRFEVLFSPTDQSLTINQCETDHGGVERIDGNIVSGDIHIMGWQKTEHGDTVLSQSPVITRGELQGESWLFKSAFTTGSSGMAYVIFKKDGTYIIHPHACISFPFIMRKP